MWFILSLLLLLVQATRAKYVDINDSDAKKYYIGENPIFPVPTSERNSDNPITDKNTLQTLFPTPPPDSVIPTSPPLPLTTLPDTQLPHGKCVCVPFWLCSNNTIITDGTDLLDIRINISNMCSNYQEKCCYHPTDPILIDTSTVTPPGQEKRYPCGKWNYKGVGFRITGNNDQEAEPGEFPWMVIIFNLHPSDKTRTEVLCGGSLIHPKVVLTAAHCLNSNLKPEDLTVRAGEWDLKVDQERNPHQDRKVVRMVKHEKYSKGSGWNDVGLVFLDEPFQLQLHINTVCLPPQDLTFDEENCKASGWGNNNDDDGVNHQAILKKVDLPIVSHDVCEEKLRLSSLGKNFNLHDSFICAGGINGKDTCRGDGGGPLVCPVAKNSTYFYQAGIVSWGVGCGNYPGLYTDVSQYRNWIDQQMADLDKSYYDVNHVV